MRFMFLVYDVESEKTEEERATCRAAATVVAHELAATGQYLAAAPLHLTSTATTVRAASGKRLVTDGPFAETREQLGGYFLVEARDLDEAISVAERVAVATRGSVEVRPIFEIDGLPKPPAVA